MATADEASEYMGGIACSIDDELRVTAPAATFALVAWMKGRTGDPAAVAIYGPPATKAEQPSALRTAAAALDALSSPDLEMHGLDTPDRVCFYEQDYYVLSNFSAFSVVYGGRRFPTLEHAYHWAKFATSVVENPVQYAIRNAASARDAFKIGQENRHLRLADWDDQKIGVMQLLLFRKCEQHEYVKRKLLQTGDRLLVENSWRDSFWGWGPNRDGQNMLGKLWMATRRFYRDQAAS